MPLYPWKNLKTQKEVEVMRTFDEYKEPPTLEEALAQGMDEGEFNEAEWFKVIGKNIKVVRGDGWGGGKGNW
jgi:hypothetical protein